jgi:hypothetical protein
LVERFVLRFARGFSVREELEAREFDAGTREGGGLEFLAGVRGDLCFDVHAEGESADQQREDDDNPEDDDKGDTMLMLVA